MPRFDKLSVKIPEKQLQEYTVLFFTDNTDCEIAASFSSAANVPYVHVYGKFSWYKRASLKCDLWWYLYHYVTCTGRPVLCCIYLQHFIAVSVKQNVMKSSHPSRLYLQNQKISFPYSLTQKVNIPLNSCMWLSTFFTAIFFLFKCLYYKKGCRLHIHWP